MSDESRHLRRRQRWLLVSSLLAAVWLLAALLPGLWEARPDGGALGAAAAVLAAYLVVPVLCLVSFDKPAALIACVIAVGGSVLLVAMKIVFGRRFGATVVLYDATGIGVQVLMGLAAVGVLALREPRTLLPPLGAASVPASRIGRSDRSASGAEE